MMVKLKAFARFRDLLGRDLELDLEHGAKVSDLLALLISRSEDLQDLIFEDPLELKDDVNVLVNGRHIESLDGLETELKEGDEVALFPAVVGG